MVVQGSPARGGAGGSGAFLKTLVWVVYPELGVEMRGMYSKTGDLMKGGPPHCARLSISGGVGRGS